MRRFERSWSVRKNDGVAVARPGGEARAHTNLQIRGDAGKTGRCR
jgi:hypothetical protein